jgi:hypothetical protein
VYVPFSFKVLFLMRLSSFVSAAVVVVGFLLSHRKSEERDEFEMIKISYIFVCVYECVYVCVEGSCAQKRQL